MSDSLETLQLYLYGVALFLSAALLFLVQPMVAKMILPYLGGSPAVWNTCLFFFQTFLLLGYLYAHFGSSWLGVKRQMALHLIIVVAALCFLPVSIPGRWLESSDSNPVNLVLWVLFASVGFPFFVLSANAPLLQKWFSNTGHADARDPYFLYAASNAGSLLGLIAYPLLLESRFNLIEQSQLWLYIYIVFMLLAFGCGLVLRNVTGSGGDERPTTKQAPDDNGAPKTALRRRLRWILLSFAPSSLLLGVTTYITTDLASVPLLWVLPLSFYLLSFIIAYRRDSWGSSPFLVKRQGFLLLAAAITVFAKATDPAAILLPLHLFAFFVTCVVCHTELAKDRPGTAYLTEYYLWISFGGLLGGFFNGFLAPLIFSSVLEYPLAMIVAALVRPRLESSSRKTDNAFYDLLWAIALFWIVFLIVWGTRRYQLSSSYLTHLSIFGVAALIGLSFARRPLRFGLGILAVLLATVGYHGPYGDLLFRARSFFGVYRATRDADNKFHFIFHGTTLHGIQALEANSRLKPISYYHPTGPAGQVFARLRASGFEKPVAVVGLGAGAIACHGKSGQVFTFYEIDPLVERIARNINLFTYLRDCPAKSAVTIGDARLTLARAPNDFYGVFILDAFSGDSIPIHLLTQEAVELYLAKLAADGMLLFHISNRYMDLTRVVDGLAAKLKLTALVQQDVKLSEAELLEGKQPSNWVLLARHEGVIRPFQEDARWKPLLGGEQREVWTDNYSNFLQVLRLW